jgi:hypothetical protein
LREGTNAQHHSRNSIVDKIEQDYMQTMKNGGSTELLGAKTFLPVSNFGHCLHATM